MDSLAESLGNWRITKYSTEIGKEDYDKELTVGGWIHDIRNLGGIAFILLRDREGIIQVTAIKKMLGKDSFQKITTLPRESVIMVKGEVKHNKEVKSGFEILPKEFKILSVANIPLPLGVADKVGADLDTRLDFRFMDIRKQEIADIFKMRSVMSKAVREQLEKEKFIEIHTPKIVATATEGGANLFKIKYFERDAYLNQSPQLYKQLMIAAGFDRVYEIGPAFRAEEHNTVRHLNEFISIDIEMAFADEEDAMGVLERVIANTITHTKNMENSRIKEVNLPFPRIEYTKCVEIAKSKGVDIKWGEDISMEASKIIAEENKSFYFITKWPTELKPFYVMPFEGDEKVCRGFDLMFAEKEITSGAQRVHDPDLLKERIKKQGLNAEQFKFYTRGFEYGMPPHAGWGLGMERLVMILTDAQNIRECVLFPRDRTRLVP